MIEGMIGVRLSFSSLEDAVMTKQSLSLVNIKAKVAKQSSGGAFLYVDREDVSEIGNWLAYCMELSEE